MISCQTFRAQFAASTNDAELLEHVRACDPCLDFAARIDPDVMFRAIGGDNAVPPGGVDAFVADVMREVHLRTTEHAMAPHRILSWPRRLAIAATIAAGVSGAMLVYQHEEMTPSQPSRPVATVRPTPSVQPAKLLISKPVVEGYDSNQATIVEVPTEGAGDTKVVMIFDEKLPADL